MTRKQNSRIIPFAALLTVAWASAGQGQEAGKKVGERLDEAGRHIKGGLERAGTATKEQYGKAKQSVQNMGIESRVYGRIHWDRMLNEAPIDLSTTADGIVTLSGSVGDARAKARAVELTRETVGVTRVVDALIIRAPVAPTNP